MTAIGQDQAQLKLALSHLQRGEAGVAEPLLRGLAAQNNGTAMYYLGAICRMRDHNEAAARRWFRSGADLGDTQCMFEVGTWLLMERDFKSARHWLEPAAAAGADNAMLNLGSLLLATDDREGARMWWQRAAKQGNAAAKQLLRANFPA